MSLTIQPGDPFAPQEPDEQAELEALTRSIRRARGFSLLLAWCNQVDQRDRLMDRIVASNPDLHIQKIPIYEPTNQLLEELRPHLESRAPDAVFVYGMEAWLPAGKAAEESPFVLNLNAARNFFPQAVPCSLVLWVPEHLLAAIAHGAPDFCSVRSGLFVFAPIATVRSEMLSNLTDIGLHMAFALTVEEREDRVAELKRLLREYESLPAETRELLVEARLLDRIATLREASGAYQEAEPLFRRALELRESALGNSDPAVAESLNNLALLLGEQGRYEDAERLLLRAIGIQEIRNGASSSGLIANLGNLASIYHYQGKTSDAESTIRRTLAIAESASHPDDVGLATALNLLSVIISSKNPFEAEELARRALGVFERVFGDSHRGVAVTLQTLGNALREQGRNEEAINLFRRALSISETNLPPDHPALATALNNISVLLQDVGSLDDAEQYLIRAYDINMKALGAQHPRTQSTWQNLEHLRRTIEATMGRK